MDAALRPIGAGGERYNNKGRVHDMSTEKKHSGGRAAGPAASADLIGANSEIGRKLRQYYDGLVAEQVPDRFEQLLRQLDKAESTGKAE